MAEVEMTYKEVDKKIDQLIAQHKALKEESQLMQQKLNDANSAVKEKDQIISKLNEQTKVLSMAKSLSGDSESNKEMKLKINGLVREIDKCISMLNN